jgi:hypothetical protein
MKIMRKLLIIFFGCLFLFSCNNKKEQDKETDTNVAGDSSENIKPTKSVKSYSPVDISPMDMSYYPVDYPKLKASTTTPPLARVIYSRPHLQGRKLFHDILKYGEPWRLGANEATELELFKTATIQGKLVKEGKYILYCIPEKDKWTIVLNANTDSWGLHPDTSKDVARFVIPVEEIPDSIEFFTMLFRQGASGAELLMAWDNVEAVLPIAF